MKKGTGLGQNKLKQVIQFMNDYDVKMSVVELPRHIINQAYLRVQTRTKAFKKLHYVKTSDISLKDFHERIMGLAYFKAMESHAIKYYRYDCFCCQET